MDEVRRPGAYVERDGSGRFALHTRQRVLCTYATRRAAQTALDRLRRNHRPM